MEFGKWLKALLVGGYTTFVVVAWVLGMLVLFVVGYVVGPVHIISSWKGQDTFGKVLGGSLVAVVGWLWFLAIRTAWNSYKGSGEE